MGELLSGTVPVRRTTDEPPRWVNDPILRGSRRVDVVAPRLVAPR
jgi:hypothetical protein